MYAAVLALMVFGAAPAGGEIKPTAVEIKPAMISLNAPPSAPTPWSCVLRRRDGERMQIMSASSSDPAIAVTWRENPAHRTHIVTATLPAGYRVKSGDRAELVIVTDANDAAPAPLDSPGGRSPQAGGQTPRVSGVSTLRVPIYVYSGPERGNEEWLRAARALIGRPAPAMTIARIGGGTMGIGKGESTSSRSFAPSWTCCWPATPASSSHRRRTADQARGLRVPPSGSTPAKPRPTGQGGMGRTPCPHRPSRFAR